MATLRDISKEVTRDKNGVIILPADVYRDICNGRGKEQAFIIDGAKVIFNIQKDNGKR